MVTKYQNDPSLMQLISKHFYSERIFDDSTSYNPKLRWRYRNFFSDNVVHGYRRNDHESYDKSQDHSHNDYSNEESQSMSENVTDSKKTNLETKRTFVSILRLCISCSLISWIGSFDGRIEGHGLCQGDTRGPFFALAISNVLGNGLLKFNCAWWESYLHALFLSTVYSRQNKLDLCPIFGEKYWANWLGFEVVIWSKDIFLVNFSMDGDLFVCDKWLCKIRSCCTHMSNAKW